MIGPRYGRTLALSLNPNGLMSATEQLFSDTAIVKQTTIVTEIIQVKGDTDILAEFCKLLDAQKRGEIDQIGLQCLRNKVNGRLRIEKSWTVPTQ